MNRSTSRSRGESTSVPGGVGGSTSLADLPSRSAWATRCATSAEKYVSPAKSVRRRVLAAVSMCADAYRLENVLRVVMHAQHEDARLRRALENLGHRVQ